MANPTPVVVTDTHGNALTITGATSSTGNPQAPTPVVLTDINGNALVLGSGGSSGPSAGTVVAKSTNYSVLSTDGGSTFNITTSAAGVSLTLPAVAPASGWEIGLTVLGTYPLLINPNGLLLSGHGISQPVNVGGGATIFSDGTNYFLLNLESLNDAPGTFNVHNYGAAGNCKRVTDAATVVSGNHVTSATANFTAADVGKAIYAVKTNVAQFSASSTILTVNSSTDVTIAGTVAHANTGCILVWGTDDTAAIQAAAAAAVAWTLIPGNLQTGAILYFPAGGYWLGGSTVPAINLTTGNVSLVGDGMNTTCLFVPPDFPYTTGAGNIISQTTSATSYYAQILTDISVDFSTVTISTNVPSFVYCAVGFVRNLQILNLTNTGTGYALVTAALSVYNLQAWSAVSSNVLNCTASAVDFFIANSYIDTSTGVAFQASSGAHIKAMNCLFYGSTYGFLVATAATGDGNFTNCRIISGSGTGVSTVVSGTDLHFVNCFIEGSTGIAIAAGTTVEASSCTIWGYTTNAVNVSSTGAFVDLGGNIVTGVLAGAGSYQGGNFVVPVIFAGATPTTSTGQVGLGNSSGIGNGSNANIQAPAVGTGSGPATPGIVVKWLEIDLAGTKYWMPLAQ